MADQDLNIHIKATDETGGAVKGLQGGVANMAQGFETAGRSIRVMGREIGQIGSAMVLAGTAMTAPLLLAYKTASTYSPQIKAQIDGMTEQWDRMSISVGNSMLPVMQQFTNSLREAVDQWNSLSQATRDNIIQTTLVAGKYLLLGGIAVKSIGEAFRVTGDLFMITGKLIQGIQGVVTAFTTMVMVNPVLLATYVVIGGIVLAMIKWKSVGDAVMNTMQTGGTVIAIAFRSVLLIVDQLSAGIFHLMDFIIGMVEKIPLLPKAWKDSLDSMRTTFDQYSKGILDASDQNVKKIGDDFKFMGSSGTGSWALTFDNMKTAVSNTLPAIENVGAKIANIVTGMTNLSSATKDAQQQTVTFWQGFTMSIETARTQWNSFFLMGQSAGKQFFSSMQTDFSNFFDNVFTGQLTKASQVFANFGNSLLKIFSNVISQMITQMIASKLWSLLAGGIGGGALGAFGGGAAAFSGPSMSALAGPMALTMHDGGPVGSSWANPVVAHDGLAVDEVPAVLQTGEGVLSRQGMSNLASLNSSNGKNGGQSAPQINITPVIQAWDANDVMRNMTAITNAIASNIMNNGQIRTIMRQYS